MQFFSLLCLLLVYPVAIGAGAIPPGPEQHEDHNHEDITTNTTLAPIRIETAYYAREEEELTRQMDEAINKCALYRHFTDGKSDDSDMRLRWPVSAGCLSSLENACSSVAIGLPVYLLFNGLSGYALSDIANDNSTLALVDNSVKSVLRLSECGVHVVFFGMRIAAFDMAVAVGALKDDSYAVVGVDLRCDTDFPRKLNSEMFDLLVDGFSENNSVETVDLSNCALNSSQISRVFNALRRNGAVNHLKQLKLSGNSVSMPDFREFLQYAVNLRFIHIHGRALGR